MIALTLPVEQRLTRTSLAQFFSDHRATWESAAKRAYSFVVGGYPKGSTVRHDDVARVLLPILEADERLRSQLNTKKLTQKYWVKDFVDLVVDRTWDNLP